MTNPRIVVDVNIIVSALLFPHSKPDLALQKAQDRGEILMSFPVWNDKVKTEVSWLDWYLPY